MPELSQPTITYCHDCEGPVYGDAKYCQSCGKLLSQTEMHRDHIDRIVEFFPHFYMTFISIIQAATLGYLLVSIKDRIAQMMGTSTYDLIWLILIVASFGVIVSVWQEYIGGNQLAVDSKAP